tara:strand:+ start:1639 stop:1848 length:210 start_codon:yes stop_codon:yes gene_type:complete
MKAEIDWYLQSKDAKPRNDEPPVPLRFCELCKTVWQSYWANHQGMQYMKFTDMPTYGLEREVCNECRQG